MSYVSDDYSPTLLPQGEEMVFFNAPLLSTSVYGPAVLKKRSMVIHPIFHERCLLFPEFVAELIIHLSRLKKLTAENFLRQGRP